LDTGSPIGTGEGLLRIWCYLPIYGEKAGVDIVIEIRVLRLYVIKAD
jgi:hypothetical protein